MSVVDKLGLTGGALRRPPTLRAGARVAKGAVKDAWERLPTGWQPAWLQQRPSWAIGIYGGVDPWSLKALAPEPVLTKHAVRDATAAFVAYPFLLRRSDRWYMFMKVFDRAPLLGRIAVAVSDDLLTWRYDRIVLREPFDLGYPHVLEDSGEVYLVPDSETTERIILYRAERFPHDWVHVADLLTGRPFRSPTIFRRDRRWWMFTETHEDHANPMLRLYHAGHLTGPWQQHPDSPVVRGDTPIVRPAGRVIEHGGELLRLGRYHANERATQVCAARITRLSPTEYVEEPLVDQPMMQTAPGGWTSDRLHHVDLHSLGVGQYVASIDAR